MSTKELNKIGVIILGKLSKKEFRERVKGAIPLENLTLTFPYRRGGIVFTKCKWQKLWDKTGGKCGYCGCELTMGNWSIDHIIPKSKGGTGRTGNIVLACKKCNSTKSDDIIEPKFIIK